MGLALYRKYRSKSLDDLVGQEHITTSLKNAFKSGKISHAYLLTGPRGVGKTSVARIIAHQVNDLPYDETSSHLDIIEIDAASNRRIDEIRDLREKVNIAPSMARYKVYIIDEAHMLTREAFNALLKTLEEPPSHAIFILATTEAHKLPETIISRTQRYNFKPIDEAEIKTHLKQLAAKEKIQISDEALDLIAKHGDGSFRDAISLLDQAQTSGEKVEVDYVRAMLGITSEESLASLTTGLSSASAKLLIDTTQAMRVQGIGAGTIAKQLARHLRKLLLEGRPVLSETKTLKLLERLIDVPASPQPYALLEVILLDAVIAEPSKTSALPAAERAILEPTAKSPEQPQQTAKEVKVAPATIPAKHTDLWEGVLKELKSENASLYSIARMAVTEIDGDQLTLKFKFGFHLKRANEARARGYIAKVLEKLSGKTFEVLCVLVPDQKRPGTKHSDTPSASLVQSEPVALDTISNIFGETEVLD